jgi:hypothetical protein
MKYLLNKIKIALVMPRGFANLVVEAIRDLYR